MELRDVKRPLHARSGRPTAGVLRTLSAPADCAVVQRCERPVRPMCCLHDVPLATFGPVHAGRLEDVRTEAGAERPERRPDSCLLGVGCGADADFGLKEHTASGRACVGEGALEAGGGPVALGVLLGRYLEGVGAGERDVGGERCIGLDFVVAGVGTIGFEDPFAGVW